MIEPFADRMSSDEDFLHDIDPSLLYYIVPISDLFGPTKEDPNFEVSGIFIDCVFFFSPSPNYPQFYLDWMCIEADCVMLLHRCVISCSQCIVVCKNVCNNRSVFFLGGGGGEEQGTCKAKKKTPSPFSG